MTHTYQFERIPALGTANHRWGAKTPMGWAYIDREAGGFSAMIHGLSGHRRVIAHVSTYDAAVEAVAREVRKRS